MNALIQTWSFEASRKLGLSKILSQFHLLGARKGAISKKLPTEQVTFLLTSNPNGQPVVMLHGGANKQARCGNDKPGKWKCSLRAGHYLRESCRKGVADTHSKSLSRCSYKAIARVATPLSGNILHEARHHGSYCIIGALLTIAPRLKAAGCEWKIAPKDRRNCLTRCRIEQLSETESLNHRLFLPRPLKPIEQVERSN